jgi:hypothetical protein
MSAGLVPAYGAETITNGIFTSGDDSRGSSRYDFRPRIVASAMKAKIIG